MTEEEEKTENRSLLIKKKKEEKITVKVSITCPHCGKVLNFNVKKYQNRNFPICTNKDCLKLIDIKISR